MGKKLIITEKPSVARDYAAVLNVRNKRQGYIENDEYIITWCVGHLVEMLYPESYDEKYKKWNLEDLPFLPTQYLYGIVPSVKDQYKIVHDFLNSNDIDVVYWAGDSGKEGQTIEENIRNFGGVRAGMNELRVWIDSQTEEELLRGIREAKPMSEYASLGDSGIMRAIEDYALGINFSRALSVKYGGLLNKAAATDKYQAIAVGRVMTCVLGMIVDREREIRNFNDTPFFRVIGREVNNVPFEWRAVEGSSYFESVKLYKENGFKTLEGAQELIFKLQGQKATVTVVEKKPTKKKAPALFNLAELQAECSKIFKITPQQTLDIVQELYEKKLTTYPRTDARVLTTAVAKEIDKNISGLKNYPALTKFAETILSEKLYQGIEKTSYTDDSKVTDHYAIIPTGQTQAVSSLNALCSKVYDLIARRFLAIFYPPAEYMQARIVLKVLNESLFASSKVLSKPGYMEISGIPKAKSSAKTNDSEDKKTNETDNDSEDEDVSSDDEKQMLLKLVDSLKVNDVLEPLNYETKEGKTSPPKRYTSGTIILAMENAGNLIEDEELRAQIKTTGIGTAATRQGILEKLDTNKYICINKKTQVITPENFGEMIYEVVKMTSPSLLNPEMTASWEKGLEGITQKTVALSDYRSKLEDFVRNGTLKIVNNDLGEQIKDKISPFVSKDAKMKRSLNLRCPSCGADLTTTPFGFGCSNYSNEEKPCRFSVGTILGKKISEKDFIELITNKNTKVIKGFKSKNGKKFDASLKLENDKISFDFSDVNEVFDTNVCCPSCKKLLKKDNRSYFCECGFKVFHTICKKQLTDKEINELLTDKRTHKKVSGMVGKSGKTFDSVLKFEDNRFVFDFNATEINDEKENDNNENKQRIN